MVYLTLVKAFKGLNLDSLLKKEETNPLTTTQKDRSLRSVVSRKRNFSEAISKTDPVLLTSGPE